MNSCARFLLAAASLLILQSAVMAQSSVRPDIKLTEQAVGWAGGFEDKKDISVGGVAFGDFFYHGIHLHSDSAVAWATWRVPSGYGTFQFYFGCSDGYSEPIQKYPSDVLQVFLDGQLYRTYEAFPKQRPLKISIPVTGVSTIKVEMKGRPRRAIVAEPRLLATATGSAPTTTSSSAPMVNNYQTANTSDAAPPAVDPKDLDRLASTLWKKADANSSLKDRVASGQIALATFLLVGIGSKDVAVNVTEDLSTSMIDAGFRLVERGQLDSVMKELKVQNTGLMDPKTIQRIGQLSGCDLIVVGSISDRGQFLVVNCRMLETETGKSLIAGQVEMRKTTLNR